ncbi:lipocalin-like domain-containing protein [Sphingomonas sp. BIUV-7]|uniref:Lipocalin-like domain-containing protein n=1 Tax=Sphingomonas natans TaxID=3063330 RepID=A0ABT8Y757_9SPHN|nr:lipocalin-like domain-containing protein [Sphingomonas sp. BIUV-7]MDO6414161.1 lipocalin-like domain-containing protein [Sphingomonas sp. BIUV-7]
MLTSLTIMPPVFASQHAVTQTDHAAPVDEWGLVGTWRLVRFENMSKDGAVKTPYGAHPRGYFMYDKTGHLSVQIMRDPPLPAFAADSKKPTDAEKTQAYGAFVSYFGTYRVDKVNHLIHHEVEGALDTTYTNTDQIRPYKLSGDTLIIEADDLKDGTHYYRELHRVR